MNRWAKLALVLAGYVAAYAVSVVTVAIYDRGFTPADNQQMGGMIAGGEMMLGCGVFGLVAVVPTGLALWFLRGSRRFWSAFTAAGLAFAIAGLAAVFLSLIGSEVVTHVPVLALVSLLGVAQMVGFPLWLGGFVLFAALAPARDLRRRMLVAAAIEILIGTFSLVHFLGPQSPI